MNTTTSPFAATSGAVATAINHQTAKPFGKTKYRDRWQKFIKPPGPSNRDTIVTEGYVIYCPQRKRFFRPVGKNRSKAKTQWVNNPQFAKIYKRIGSVKPVIGFMRNHYPTTGANIEVRPIRFTVNMSEASAW